MLDEARAEEMCEVWRSGLIATQGELAAAWGVSLATAERVLARRSDTDPPRRRTSRTARPSVLAPAEAPPPATSPVPAADRAEWKYFGGSPPPPGLRRARKALVKATSEHALPDRPAEATPLPCFEVGEHPRPA
jgi:hypothetical protein